MHWYWNEIQSKRFSSACWPSMIALYPSPTVQEFLSNRRKRALPNIQVINYHYTIITMKKVFPLCFICMVMIRTYKKSSTWWDPFYKHVLSHVSRLCCVQRYNRPIEYWRKLVHRQLPPQYLLIPIHIIPANR